MKLLAIETATPAVSSALWEDGAPVAGFSLVAGQRHAEVLMPAVDRLFRLAGWQVGDVDAVAVDNGPGLFTGLRVGLATARAISAARDVPAVGVSSLDVLVHPLRRRPGPVAAVVDARRSEVFWALYRSDGERLQRLRPPEVVTPSTLAGILGALAGSDPAQGTLLAVGDGAWRYRDELVAAGAEVDGPAEMWPGAGAVAELGWWHLREHGAPVAPPRPVYLRQADVRIGWEEISGRVGAPAGPVGPVAPVGHVDPGAPVDPGAAGAAPACRPPVGAGPARSGASLGG